MTSFSLSAFRDFCAAKPEGERYGAAAWDRSDDLLGISRSQALVALSEEPRTYGALTARLDALIEGEKK